MGHTLGFKVLAEGVETPEQLAFLQEKGCDIYQGYLKSPAVTAEAFAELLRAQEFNDTPREIKINFSHQPICLTDDYSATDCADAH
jgi:c-di-GMP-related signal transduction protein